MEYTGIEHSEQSGEYREQSRPQSKEGREQRAESREQRVKSTGRTGTGISLRPLLSGTLP
ncbi:MAG: hypothetical protein ACE3L7_22260 [Candidatus Pristimantibacillus sp.]